MPFVQQPLGILTRNFTRTYELLLVHTCIKGEAAFDILLLLQSYGFLCEPIYRWQKRSRDTLVYLALLADCLTFTYR